MLVPRLAVFRVDVTVGVGVASVAVMVMVDREVWEVPSSTVDIVTEGKTLLVWEVEEALEAVRDGDVAGCSFLTSDDEVAWRCAALGLELSASGTIGRTVSIAGTTLLTFRV